MRYGNLLVLKSKKKELILLAHVRAQTDQHHHQRETKRAISVPRNQYSTSFRSHLREFTSKHPQSLRVVFFLYSLQFAVACTKVALYKYSRRPFAQTIRLYGFRFACLMCILVLHPHVGCRCRCRRRASSVSFAGFLNKRTSLVRARNLTHPEYFYILLCS